jgi:hypothetical protein
MDDLRRTDVILSLEEARALRERICGDGDPSTLQERADYTSAMAKLQMVCGPSDRHRRLRVSGE